MLQRSRRICAFQQPKDFQLNWKFSHTKHQILIICKLKGPVPVKVLFQRTLLLVDIRKSLSDWVKTLPLTKPLRLVPFTILTPLSASCTKLDYHDLLRLLCNIWPRNKSLLHEVIHRWLCNDKQLISKQTCSTKLECPRFLVGFSSVDCFLAYWIKTNKQTNKMSVLPHLPLQNIKGTGWLILTYLLTGFSKISRVIMWFIDSDLLVRMLYLTLAWIFQNKCHTQRKEEIKRQEQGDALISQTYSLWFQMLILVFPQVFASKGARISLVTLLQDWNYFKKLEKLKRLEEAHKSYKSFLGNVHVPGRPSPHLSFFRAHNACLCSSAVVLQQWGVDTG